MLSSPKNSVNQTKKNLFLSKGFYTVLFLISLCFCTDLYCKQWLPDTVPNKLDFSVSRSRSHLKDLVALGPRVAGTYTNDVQTVKLLKAKLLEMSRSAPSHVLVEVEEQHPSGYLHLNFLNGITNMYKNVSNVILKISWPEMEAQHIQSPGMNDQEQSILLNAHFDSVPGSPGASDDGVGVAVMLEAARSLIMGPPLNKPIVMLFNGAEESMHHAAHGFITQHKWAKNIKYMINLEAIGAGGREMVFQCNSGELAALYGKAAPYRYAQAIAHELFKYLIWRAASTDWLYFLKHGPPGMHGLDTAYINNGYVYHTMNDKEEILLDGTFLNTGANVLQLAKALSLSTEDDFDASAGSEDPGKELVVFFDVMGGLFFVSYRGVSVYVIHSLILFFGVFTVLAISPGAYAHLTEILSDELVCLFVPIMVSVVFGLICHVVCPMVWYLAGENCALVMFAPPALLSAAWTRGYFVARRKYKSESAVRQSSSVLMWVLVTAPLVAAGLASAYVLCFWIVFSSLAMIVYYFIVRSKKRKKVSTNVIGRIVLSMDENIAYMVCLMPCTFTWFSMMSVTLTAVIPLTGKTGTVVPGDVIVAGLVGALVAFPTGSLMANHIGARVSSFAVKVYSACIFFLVFYIVCFNNVSYSAIRPKRLWLQHVERVIEKRSGNGGAVTTTHDYGIWVSGFDGQGLQPLVDLDHKQIKHKYRKSAACDFSTGDCFMSFPWYFPVPDVIRDSMYIPTKAPPVLKNPNQRLRLFLSTFSLPKHKEDKTSKGKTKESEISGGDNSEYRFIDVTLVGSTHMALVIQDNAMGSRIVAWDLGRMEDVADGAGNVVLRNSTSRDEAGLIAPFPPRSEGIYYLQVGFGLCPADICSKIIRLKVKGNGPVEFTAYSHYVEMWEDPALQSFHNSLPGWSQNAYFSQFPSLLVSKAI